MYHCCGFDGMSPMAVCQMSNWMSLLTDLSDLTITLLHILNAFFLALRFMSHDRCVALKCYEFECSTYLFFSSCCSN